MYPSSSNFYPVSGLARQLGPMANAGAAQAGNIYFVDSGHTQASNGNPGTSPDLPLSTLNGAYDKVTANNGDVIYLMPGHAENTSAAGSQTCDIAGVKVIGVGHGAARPTFTWTATAGTFEVDAASTYIENVLFLSSISAVVVGVNVDADDATFVNCEWNFDASGDDFLIMADLSGSATNSISRTKFYGCKFMAEDASGAASGLKLYNSDETEVVGCWFFGDYTAGCIESDTTNDTGGATAVSAGILIAFNHLQNQDTGGAVIDLNNADTGIIAYNNLGSGKAGLGSAGASVLDSGSCKLSENYATTGTNVTAAVVPQTADT